MSSFLEYRPQYSYKRELEAIIGERELTLQEHHDEIGHDIEEKEATRLDDLEHFKSITSYEPSPVVEERFEITPTDVYENLITAQRQVAELVDRIGKLNPHHSLSKSGVPSIEEYITAWDSKDGTILDIFEEHYSDEVEDLNSSILEALPLLLEMKEENETLALIASQQFPLELPDAAIPNFKPSPSNPNHTGSLDNDTEIDKYPGEYPGKDTEKYPNKDVDEYNKVKEEKRRNYEKIKHLDGEELIELMRNNLETLREEEKRELMELVEKDREGAEDRSNYSQINHENHVLKSLYERLSNTQAFVAEIKELFMEGFEQQQYYFKRIELMVNENPHLRKLLITSNQLNFAKHKTNLEDSKKRMNRLTDKQFKVRLYEELEIRQGIKMEMKELMSGFYNLPRTEEEDEINIYILEQLEIIETVREDVETLTDDLYRVTELEELQEIDYMTSLLKKSECRTIQRILRGQPFEPEEYGEGY